MKKTFSGLMVGAMLVGGAFQTASLVSAQAQTGNSGSGEVKVTYNANIVAPDVGTDPDFAVLIPSSYQMSDKDQYIEGVLKMVDKDDYTQAYTGGTTIDVTVQSDNGFVFANGGQYKIVDSKKATVWDASTSSPVTLKAGTVDKAINAQLTKKAGKDKANTPSADKLTFSYVVK